MASYSSWHGVKMHGNHALLTEVLKGRMGFDGLVLGDWNGHAQLPGCTPDSCAAALNAGLDVLMAPDGWRELHAHTLAQVRQGEISDGTARRCGAPRAAREAARAAWIARDVRRRGRLPAATSCSARRRIARWRARRCASRWCC